MADYYFPPVPGKVGSDPRDWWDQKIPADYLEATKQIAKVTKGRLFDSVTGSLLFTSMKQPNGTYPTIGEPTTIRITESAGFTKDWIWPIVIGVGFLFVWLGRQNNVS